MSTDYIRPPLSIGVVTHDRSVAFSKLLKFLIPAIQQYGSHCEVVVANNSGPTAHQLVESIVDNSELRQVCECRVIDSNQNNISTGRNVVLSHANEDILVFVDDDEYPEPTWLIALVDALQDYGCKLVAGPILPVFLPSAPQWVQAVDLHNTHNHVSGAVIDYAASGNFIMNRKGIKTIQFNESFGKSGGEDTEFFLKLKDKGYELRWCAEAIVYEDIPLAKSSPNYMIHRFMTQGRSYRTIKEQRGEVASVLVFVLRAAVIASFSITVAWVLMRTRPSVAAKWMKRGYSNLGKITQPKGHLYE